MTITEWKPGEAVSSDEAGVVELIVRSAQQRKESRGLHYMADHPEPTTAAADTVIHDKPGGPLT